MVTLRWHLKLGARELGWEVWDGRQVIELTSNQIIKAIQNGGGTRGLQIGDNGNESSIASGRLGVGG